MSGQFNKCVCVNEQRENTNDETSKDCLRLQRLPQEILIGSSRVLFFFKRRLWARRSKQLNTQTHTQLVVGSISSLIITLILLV